MYKRKEEPYRKSLLEKAKKNLKFKQKKKFDEIEAHKTSKHINKYKESKESKEGKEGKEGKGSNDFDGLARFNWSKELHEQI